MKKLVLSAVLFFILFSHVSAQEKVYLPVIFGENNCMVAPITPIIDDANRANTGPPPSSNWTTYTDGTTITGNGLKVSSSVIKGDSNSAFNAAYWNTQFGADSEL